MSKFFHALNYVINAIGLITLALLVLFAVFVIFAFPWIIAQSEGMTIAWIVGCTVYDVLMFCLFYTVLEVGR